MFLHTLTALLLLLGAPHEQPAKEFENFIRPYVTTNNFSGNVLVEHHGKIVFQRSYGYSDREHKRSNKDTTQFHIASMSMQYTSASILRLLERHKLTLETTIANLLPNTSGAEKITVSDLLLQQSGLDDINSHSDYEEVLQRHQTPASLVAQLRFRFPADFYQSNAEMTMFSCKGDTFLRWPSGELSPLIPIGADEWIDRSYWELVRLDRDLSGVPDALQYDRFRASLAP